MKIEHRYIADDGREFESELDCQRHEFELEFDKIMESPSYYAEDFASNMILTYNQLELFLRSNQHLVTRIYKAIAGAEGE